MNTSQRRRRNLIEELVAVCLKQGLGSFELRQEIHDHMVTTVPPDAPAYADLWARADRVSRAGLMAQLYFLVDAKGWGPTQRLLLKSGSELDAFVKGYSCTAEEQEADIGRENVNDDGVIVID